jgi:hypothetical protein
VKTLRVASFTVHATAAQSARWKQAAEAEGFTSAGAWLACAADAYLKARARAGQPVPLAWRRGRFLVRLESGEEVQVRGQLSDPFGVFMGTAAGPRVHGRQHAVFTLTYLPSRRILATVASFRECKALASDLARVWVRSDDPETAP